MCVPQRFCHLGIGRNTAARTPEIAPRLLRRRHSECNPPKASHAPALGMDSEPAVHCGNAIRARDQLAWHIEVEGGDINTTREPEPLNDTSHHLRVHVRQQRFPSRDTGITFRQAARRVGAWPRIALQRHVHTMVGELASWATLMQVRPSGLSKGNPSRPPHFPLGWWYSVVKQLPGSLRCWRWVSPQIY